MGAEKMEDFQWISYHKVGGNNTTIWEKNGT